MNAMTPLQPEHSVVLISGYGPGLGEALARALLTQGYYVCAMGRHQPMLDLPSFTGLQVDLSQADDVTAAFQQLDQLGPPLAAVIHNPAHLVIESFLNTQMEDFQACWQSMVQSAICVAQAALPRMLARSPDLPVGKNVQQAVRGRMIFSGATASIRGGARFAAFASAKFALRGLVQSLAREFQGQGVQVAHVILDGIIWSEKSRQRHGTQAAQCLLPEDIAQTYLHLLQQAPSTWTHELDLRPASEKF